MPVRRLVVGLALVAGTALAGSPAVPALGASPSPSVPPSSSVAPSPEASGGPAPVLGPVTTPAPPPEIRVLDAGRRPRAVRRYAFTPRMTQTMVMDMTQTVTSSAGGMDSSMALPAIRYALTMTVLEVDADGAATIEATVESAAVLDDPEAGPPPDQAIVDAIDAALAPLIGIRMTILTDRRGYSRPLTSDLGGLDPTMAQQLRSVMDQSAQISTVLPAQALGVGARWISTGTATANGISIRMRQTYRLRSVRRGTLVITMNGTQTGVPGPLDSPDIPARYSASLVSLEGTLRGRMSIDLRRLVPRSTASGTVTTRLTVTDGTSEQTVESAADSRIVVHPGE